MSLPMVVVREIPRQAQSRPRRGLMVPQVHILVLHRPPQTLDHDVIKRPTGAVHADRRGFKSRPLVHMAHWKAPITTGYMSYRGFTERAGFEPAVPFRAHGISSAARSATLSPLLKIRIAVGRRRLLPNVQLLEEIFVSRELLEGLYQLQHFLIDAESRQEPPQHMELGQLPRLDEQFFFPRA